MLARYSGSIALGAVVTAALIYWMQQLIGGGDFEPLTSREIKLPPYHIVETPPLPIDRTTIVLLPQAITPPTLPISDDSIIPLTTGPVGPDGPVTPPGLPSPPVRLDGRQGLWIADSNLMIRSQAQPIYPLKALRRELEGYVLVEFTVTKRGDVRDVRVVESSHEAFEQAAATAVARSRYQPRVINSIPVDVAGLRTQIAFMLDD